MNVPYSNGQPSFRVSVLQPISMGRARVLESWVTDGAGAVDALEHNARRDLAIQIELERWDEDISPTSWVAGSWGTARAITLQ